MNNKISKWEINKVEIGDKDYPAQLTKLTKPPQKLYYRGQFDQLNYSKSIAIVGSRRCTRYGADVVDKLTLDLVANKINIISGFMYGIDTIAHTKAVEYGGTTLAILGCGLNVIYPTENQELYIKILESGGAVVSEYEPDSKPHLWKFPQRNRIVAALSQMGVLVIEAGEKSGSLITAKLAKEINREVYAVPGPITSSVSKGTNNLIKVGEARLVGEIDDILGNKSIKSSKQPKIELPKEQSEIYKLLEVEEHSADEIAIKLQKDIAEITTTLTMMSLSSLVVESGGRFYLANK